jgi:uncharacterized membrane-anchored protein
LLLSGLLFAAVIAFAAIGQLVLRLNPVLMFWIAYIFTRPLGANLGDLLSLDPDEGGLGLGPAAVTALFLALIVGCIAYLTLTKRDAGTGPRDADGS